MMRIHFKDLAPSQLAREVTWRELGEVLDKFPEMRHHRVTITLSMLNSIKHEGPDEFQVKIFIRGPKFSNILLIRNAVNLYIAVAEVKEALLERLNRSNDKPRVQLRLLNRRFKQEMRGVS